MENKNLKPNTVTSKSKFERGSAWLFSKLKNGFIGRFLTSYEKINEKYVSSVKSRRAKKSSLKKIEAKRTMSRLFEKSFFVRKAPMATELLLRTSVRDYGITLLTMGFFVFILYPLRNFVTIIDVSFSQMIIGIMLCVCSLPLLFSSRSYASCVLTCTPLRMILFSWLGLKPDSYRAASEKTIHTSPNISFVIGMLLGVLSYFTGPMFILKLFIIALLTYTVLTTPEAGIVILLFGLPFLSIPHLILITIYVDICFLIKYIIGKRTFKFELFDFGIVGVVVMLLYGYAVSADYEGAHIITLTNAALVMCYFAVANLIRSKDQYKRCITSFVSSVCITSVVGIIQYILGELNYTWQGIEAFSTIRDRITSSFYDPDVFALYLCVSLPFTMLFISSGTRLIYRLSGLFTLATSLTCIVMTESRAAIIAAVVEILLFLLIYNKNYIYLIFAVGCSIPILYYSLPKEFLSVILSFGSKSVATGAKRDLLRQIALGIFKSRPYGMGSGDGSMSEMMDRLFPSADGITELGSLYYQLLASYGILGVLLILSCLTLFTVLSVTFISRAVNKHRRVNGAVGFISIVGILVSGAFINSLRSSELVFITFMAIGLSFAYYKIERELDAPKSTYVDITTASADIAIPADISKVVTPKRKYVHAPMKKGKLTRSQAAIKELMNSNEFIRVIDEKTEMNDNDKPH